MKIRSTILALLAAASLAPSVASAANAYAATADSRIILFDLADPATIISQSLVTGLVMSDGVTPDAFGSIFNLALSGDTGAYFGLDGNANFYQINVTTGVSTFLSNSFTPVGFDAGFAFDPFTGGFQFVSDAAENVAISTAGLVSPGTPTFYSAGDTNAVATPVFVGLGIDPAFGTPYAIDSSLGILASSVDPNFARFDTVGSLGVSITGNASAFVDEDGNLFASLSEDGFNSSLYSVDTGSGLATKIGDFGFGVNSIAAVPARHRRSAHRHPARRHRLFPAQARLIPHPSPKPNTPHPLK